MSERAVIHMVLHVLVPGVVAWAAFADRWPRAWIVMLLALLIDADHLLATPVYDPNRCGLGFHPLHSVWAAGVYLALLVPASTRVLGTGLVLHLALDGLDCLWIALEAP